MARSWCAAQAAQAKHSSFAWFFDRQLPGDKCGAWHSSDLWYWFGTLRNCWRPMTRKNEELSRLMSSYLTNFAKNGDPNGQGLPGWTAASPSDNRVMRLGEKPAAMRKVSRLKLVLTMLTNKAVGE